MKPENIHPVLAPFQRAGAMWLAGNITALLADEMGVGKSAQAIAACDVLECKTILIVCPGIARKNWLREIDKWQTIKRETQAIMGTKDLITAPVVVISYSLLRSIKVLRVLVSRRWDALILDEAQFAKSNEAWRTMAIYGGKHDARHGISSVAKRVWLLSGTPMPNNPAELWTHCHALFPDVAQDMSYERWRDEYCRMIPGTTKVVGTKNEGKLVKLLKPHVMRRMSKDVLPELPSLRLAHVPVDPKTVPPMDEQTAEARAVMEAAIATMATPSGERKGKILLQGLAEVQMASLRRWTGIAKAPAVAEYLKMDIEAGMGKFVVFAWHRDVIEIIRDSLPDTAAIYGGVSDKKNQEWLDDFQNPNGRLQGLVCQIEKVSTAIPLTAASHCIFAEAPWTVTHIEQAIKRVHRQGQTRPVTGRLFSLSGSFDEVLVSVLTRKASDVMRVNRALET